MIFIDACFRKPTPYTPIWMMRQAGRYLPEYMAVREKAGDFLNLCKNPKLACEVTLQPVDILGVDAAILFSDILVIPLEMGMDLKFIKGKGPIFPEPLKDESQLCALDENAHLKLTYVYDTIKLIREKLANDKALIGFTGSPWTLATYMIEGQGTKVYNIIKKEIYKNPKFIHKLLKIVTQTVKLYLEEQIKSGVNAVQIFDSWAAALEEDKYLEFSWSYIQEICTYIKSKYPHIPIIVFPKSVPAYLDKLDGDFDVLGIDWGTPMEFAKDKIGDKFVLQGNLEPARLYSKEAIDDGVQKIVDVMKNEGHIFNLGHGMIPDLPVENAKYLVKRVQELTKR